MRYSLCHKDCTQLTHSEAFERNEPYVPVLWQRIQVETWSQQSSHRPFNRKEVALRRVRLLHKPFENTASTSANAYRASVPVYGQQLHVHVPTERESQNSHSNSS